MVMTRAIDPGPDRPGIAKGVKEMSIFCRASISELDVEFAFLREQHTEAQKRHDHAAGDAQARNGNAEQIHDQHARQQEHQQDRASYRGRPW